MCWLDFLKTKSKFKIYKIKFQIYGRKIVRNDWLELYVIDHSQGVKISYQFLLANILKSTYANDHHNYFIFTASFSHDTVTCISLVLCPNSFFLN